MIPSVNCSNFIVTGSKFPSVSMTNLSVVDAIQWIYSDVNANSYGNFHESFVSSWWWINSTNIYLSCCSSFPANIHGFKTNIIIINKESFGARIAFFYYFSFVVGTVSLPTNVFGSLIDDHNCFASLQQFHYTNVALSFSIDMSPYPNVDFGGNLVSQYFTLICLAECS